MISLKFKVEFLCPMIGLTKSLVRNGDNFELIYGAIFFNAKSPSAFDASFSQKSFTITLVHLAKSISLKSLSIKTLGTSTNVHCSSLSDISNDKAFLMYCSNIGPPVVFKSYNLSMISSNSLIIKVCSKG